MSESTEGIAIRRIDYSETSLIVHFYTPDFGQVATLAKGAKRPRSSFQGGIDLMTRNQIVFARRAAGGLATLMESAILDDYRGLRADFDRLARAQYAAELITVFTTEEDPNRGLYDRFVRALEALASGTGSAVSRTIAFELALLSEVGYALDWAHCTACGSDLDVRRGAVFSVTAGGAVCRSCAGSAGRGLPLGPGELAAAAGLAGGGRRAERLRLAEDQVRHLGRVIAKYITYLAGRPPKMLQYLDKQRLTVNRG